MMRVVFVDDEARILDGLARMLRSQRHEWSIAFAPSGTAALELLDEGPVDLVVTDFSMPGIDGLELLEAVRERCPRAARVILSGYTAASRSARATSVAHLTLMKPAESGSVLRLLHTIRRVTSWVPEEVRDAVGGYGSLPVAEPSLDSLRAALECSGSDLSDVAALAEIEPAVAGKLLQAVNSAFFGIFPPASDLHDAIRMLGVPPIREMVSDVATFRGGVPVVPIPSSAVSEPWTTDERQAGSRSASLVCQLRLLGEILVADALPSKYERVRLRSTTAASSDEAARLELGTTFARVGAYLAGLWNYPAELVGAIAGDTAVAAETTGILATGRLS